MRLEWISRLVLSTAVESKFEVNHTIHRVEPSRLRWVTFPGSWLIDTSALAASVTRCRSSAQPNEENVVKAVLLALHVRLGALHIAYFSGH